jgi:hypothetical protein
VRPAAAIERHARRSEADEIVYSAVDYDFRQRLVVKSAPEFRQLGAVHVTRDYFDHPFGLEQYA